MNIKKHKLIKKAISYVILNNDAANLPYHNNQHLLDVFNNVIKLSKKEGLSKKNTIELSLAALFHDFNHSGGKLADNKNILNAIDGFNRFFEINGRFFEDFSTKNIEILIRQTEYPSVKEPTTIQQQIIMDADMVILYKNNKTTTLNIISGLSDEWSMTINDAIAAQYKFIDKCVFYTSYAKRLFRENKTKMIDNTKYVESIFNPYV